MAKSAGVRFYFRDKDKWSNFIKLNVGFDASFRLDKTTDDANISFILNEEPTWLKINMWAALFINADSNHVEINADGTPKNHDQFIIGGYQYYKTTAGYYVVTMKLVEPIERFRGILGETLSYTNQISKVVDDKPYTKEPYNYYTALKRWLQVTPANIDSISRNSEKKDANGIAWWNRITILDKDFLSSLPFADDTLNELSLYDLLFNIYDSGTGRTPVAYFDLRQDGGLDKLPRNNKRDEYLLKFIRQDGLDKPVLEWSDLVDNKAQGFDVCTGVLKREDGADYATGLVANVTNLSPNTRTTFPAQGLYAVPEALIDKRNTIGIGKGQGQWGIVLPHKIKNVISLKELKINGYESSDQIPGSETIHHLSRQILDRTVVEQKQKAALYEDDEDVDYYNEGDNIVYINDYESKNLKYGNAPNNVFSQLYYIEYEPLVDARICIGDDEYVQQINQTASQVDSEKFGKFMQDYLDGMGKADYTIQRTTENPELYLGYFGSRVKRDGKFYIITNIAILNRNFQYDVVLQLNENHTRKNLSYQAPQNIRANTAIQYENVCDRKTNYKQEVQIDLRQADKDIADEYRIKKRPILNVLGVYADSNLYPQMAEILVSEQAKSYYTNIATFVAANQVGVNINIGNAVIGKTKKIQIVNAGPYADDLTGSTYSDPFNSVTEQIPILYTDAFGEVDKVLISILSIMDSNLGEINDSRSSEEYLKTVNFQNAMANINTTATSGGKVITTFGLNLQKDMLENCNITCSIILKGQSEGIKIHNNALANSRVVVQNDDIDTIKLIFTNPNNNATIIKEFACEFVGDESDKDSELHYVYVGEDYIEYDYSDNALDFIPSMIHIMNGNKSKDSYNDVLTIMVDELNFSDTEKNGLKQRLKIYF